MAKGKEKKPLNMKRQWAKFIIVLVLYLLFLYWVKSWLGLIVVPFIYDFGSMPHQIVRYKRFQQYSFYLKMLAISAI